MSATILTFPTDRLALGVPVTRPPDPYDFWFSLLEEMAPRQRERTITEANRCGVISDRDAYIFRTSWPEDRGA